MSYKGKNGERSENIVHDIYEQFIAGKGKRQWELTATGARRREKCGFLSFAEQKGFSLVAQLAWN